MDKLGIVFANIGDEELGVLTAERSKASMPFGGRYRFIDFVLSNLVNGGVEKVGIATRANYQSLMDHVGNGREWDLDRRTGGLFMLPPFGTNGSGRYVTKLEALFGSLQFLRRSTEQYVFLCEPDVIANIDLDRVVDAHEETGADVTVLCQTKELFYNPASAFFSGRVDEKGRLVDLNFDGRCAEGSHYSLGIYLIRRELLLSMLDICAERGYTSFDRDVLAGMNDVYNIRAYDFAGYACKVRSGAEYYDASMALLRYPVRSELFYENGRIFTKTHDDVPVLYGLDSKVENSLVADGSSINGAVCDSILFRRVKTGKNSAVKNCILMQDCEVGEGAVMEYCVADKEVFISPGAVLKGTPEEPIVIPKGRIVSK